MKKHGLYFNVPASQLVFLKQKDHLSLHKSGRPSGMSGKHLSEEARKRISNANKGRVKTEETRRKLSEAHKGKKFSEEHRRKLSEAKKGNRHPRWGKHISEELRMKMSEGMKRYWDFK